ncbi:MAG: L,D-transpeptidase [Desulfurella sp.]
MTAKVKNNIMKVVSNKIEIIFLELVIFLFIFTAQSFAISSELMHSMENIQKAVRNINKEYSINNSVAQKKDLFSNSTTIKGNLNFLQNITLLYKMGYLPFYPLSIKDNTVIWQWNAKHIPEELLKLTPESKNNILYKGAILAFLSENNVVVGHDSSLNELLRDVYDHGSFIKKKQFVWVFVNKTLPERLKVWQRGGWVFEANVNTGIDNLTPNGNFIIYKKYKRYNMKGIFPINTKPYDIKNVPYVEFFYKGYAIHGFYRYAYGYPQSAGCIELSVSNAKILYHLLYVGTVVSIGN